MVYFVAVSWFGKGDGVKAPRPLCPEVALQKAAAGFFVARVPQNLTGKDNSQKGNSVFSYMRLSPETANIYHLVPFLMTGGIYVSIKNWTETTGELRWLPVMLVTTFHPY